MTSKVYHTTLYICVCLCLSVCLTLQCSVARWFSFLLRLSYSIASSLFEPVSLPLFCYLCVSLFVSLCLSVFLSMYSIAVVCLSISNNLHISLLALPLSRCLSRSLTNFVGFFPLCLSESELQCTCCLPASFPNRPVSLLACLPIYIPVYFSVCLFVCLSVCRSVCRSLCLSVCLCVYSRLH